MQMTVCTVRLATVREITAHRCIILSKTKQVHCFVENQTVLSVNEYMKHKALKRRSERHVAVLLLAIYRNVDGTHLTPCMRYQTWKL